MKHKACILNTGVNAWAFQPLAEALSLRTGLAISSTPRERNYLLGCDGLPDTPSQHEYFVPIGSIQLACDKRLIANCFSKHDVSCPRTVLLVDIESARKFAVKNPKSRWCIKYPTGCAATGHRMLDDIQNLPASWPMPLVVQEFIEMERPEVYRTYCVAGQVFGWVARRFPQSKVTSPWVAHARGARYEDAGKPPNTAVNTAIHALKATGLLKSFGCVDLVQDTNQNWLALEVGTDGGLSFVDRDINNSPLEQQLTERLSEAIVEFVSN